MTRVEFCVADSYVIGLSSPSRPWQGSDLHRQQLAATLHRLGVSALACEGRCRFLTGSRPFLLKLGFLSSRTGTRSQVQAKPLVRKMLPAGQWIVRLSGTACGFFLFSYVLPQLVFRPVWPALMAAFGTPLFANTVGSQIVHFAVYAVANLFFLALYRGNLAPLQQYKINPGPWPWQQGGEQRAAFLRHVATAVLCTLFNNIVIGLPLSVLTYRDAAPGAYGDTRLSTFPSGWTIAWQLVGCLLAEDFAFYVAHRAMHDIKPFYRWFHKQHHSFHYSVSVAAEYLHPVDFLLSGAIPFIVGPKLLGVHTVVLYSWMCWRIAGTLEGHSGFCFPFSLFRVYPPSGQDHVSGSCSL